ncbi:MAG: type II secretion system protein GspC [Myxococcota bacterium]
MQHFIIRHGYLLRLSFTVSCVIACAVLAARTANHLIESQYLLGQAHAAHVPPTSLARVDSVPDPPRSKDGTRLAERNIFCSSCTVEDTSASPVTAPVTGDEIPLTDLPLELLATNLASNAAESFATVRNSSSGHQGSFYPGGQLPGGGPIETIAATQVVFHNRATDRLERLSLLQATKPAPARRVAAQRSPPRRPASTAQYDQHVKKLDDNSYEVERGLVTQLMSNPMKLGARAMPDQKDGRIVGLRLASVRRNSPLNSIGLRSGDTIHAINGYELTSPDEMLAAYAKLKNADNLEVHLSRRGQPVEMRYQVR